MAIELEMPANMEQIVEVEMDSTATDQAVGLLEAETEPDVMDEGREIEGLDGETIPIADETIEGVIETNESPCEPQPAPEISELSPEAAEVHAADTVLRDRPYFAFKMRVREISDELAEAALERLTAECTFKQAKAREKLVLEKLAKVMHEGPQVMPLFDQASRPAAESIAPDAATWQEAGETQDCPSGPVTIEPLTDDAWRSVPISDLDLKPKLNERLEEAGATTIGRLEDLRAEISQGREKWPKGIGKAKITEIEDAVIEWLSKNRDRQVLAEARAESQAQTTQHEAEASQESAEFDPCARAVKLDEDDLDPQHPEGTGCWESGRQAWSQDAQVSECPYVAGPEADDWIRGWMSAGKDDQGQERIQDNGKAVSLDDL